MWIWSNFIFSSCVRFPSIRVWSVFHHTLIETSDCSHMTFQRVLGLTKLFGRREYDSVVADSASQNRHRHDSRTTNLSTWTRFGIEVRRPSIICFHKIPNFSFFSLQQPLCTTDLIQGFFHHYFHSTCLMFIVSCEVYLINPKK